MGLVSARLRVGSGASPGALWREEAAPRVGGGTRGSPGRPRLPPRSDPGFSPVHPAGRRCHLRAPSPRCAAAPPRGSAGPCPPQQFSIGSACGPISRRLSPGDGGRGFLHRPLPRAPAKPRLCPGAGGGPAGSALPPRLPAARRGAGGWLGWPPGPAVSQVGHVPTLGFSSRVRESGARTGFKSSTARKSLTNAELRLASQGLGSERGQ